MRPLHAGRQVGAQRSRSVAGIDAAATPVSAATHTTASSGPSQIGKCWRDAEGNQGSQRTRVERRGQGGRSPQPKADRREGRAMTRTGSVHRGGKTPNRAS